jgi:hypothetical protein
MASLGVVCPRDGFDEHRNTTGSADQLFVKDCIAATFVAHPALNRRAALATSAKSWVGSGCDSAASSLDRLKRDTQ